MVVDFHAEVTRVFHRELTERKLAEDALEASREQLLQSQKMEALGQLTGGMAHDFNNLLAAILGSLRIAQRRQRRGEDVAESINNAIDAAERGAALTQRLLAFARKQDLKLEPTDIIKSLKDMKEILKRTLGKQVSIKTDFPAMLEPVLTDRAQLELAILNLVVNARDAMPDGGEIMLRAQTIDANGTGKPWVLVSIKDQGHGMDKETLARALEPFFTTKEVGKGTGLGLPMVKGMIEQSGGQLALHSEIGRGTTVELMFPVIAEVIKEPSETASEAQVDCEKLRILVVDDEAIILLSTSIILSEMGHDVLEAYSGAEALTILENEQVDLLVTDFAMPKMNGRELIERTRALHPDLKIIVASGYVDLPEGTSLDAVRLNKPFTERELENAIAALFT